MMMSNNGNTEKSTTRLTLDERIAKMEIKLKQAKAKKELIEAKEKAVLTERKRKDDTRRKILLGAYMLDLINTNEIERERIEKGLDTYLTKKTDRALFNLPEKIETIIP